MRCWDRLHLPCNCSKLLQLERYHSTAACLIRQHQTEDSCRPPEDQKNTCKLSQNKKLALCSKRWQRFCFTKGQISISICKQEKLYPNKDVPFVLVLLKQSCCENPQYSIFCGIIWFACKIEWNWIPLMWNLSTSSWNKIVRTFSKTKKPWQTDQAMKWCKYWCKYLLNC